MLMGSWVSALGRNCAGGRRGYHTVGLNSDGTVVAVGGDTYGECSTGDWGRWSLKTSAHGDHIWFGTGTVTSSSPGIGCSPDCVETMMRHSLLP